MNNNGLPVIENNDASELINPSFLNDDYTPSPVPEVQPTMQNDFQPMIDNNFAVQNNAMNNGFAQQAPMMDNGFVPQTPIMNNNFAQQAPVMNNFNQNINTAPNAFVAAAPNNMVNQAVSPLQQTNVAPILQNNATPMQQTNIAPVMQNNAQQTTVATAVQDTSDNHKKSETAISRILDGTDDKLTEDEELLLAYIGNNAEKLLGKKFNFAAFFFSELYYFYRKMILKAFLLHVLYLGISLLCIIVFKSEIVLFIFALLFSILIGFATNDNYVDFAQKNIAKIRAENPNANKAQLIALCKKEGGGSILWIFLGSFITGAITSAIVYAVIFILAVTAVDEKGYPIIGTIGNDNTNNNSNVIEYSGDNTIHIDFSDNDNDNDTNTNSSGANKYNGVFLYSMEDVNKEFVASPITGYKSSGYTGSIGYEGMGIEYKLNGLQNYTDAKELADSMYDYFKKGYNEAVQTYKSQGMQMPTTYFEPTRPTTKTVNGITWYIVRSYSFRSDAYYLTQKGKTVYLLSIEAIDKGTLDSSEEQVVNSIKYK